MLIIKFLLGYWPLLILIVLGILMLIFQTISKNLYRILFDSYDYLQIPLVNSNMKRILQDEQASMKFQNLIQKEQTGKLKDSDYLDFEGRKYRLKRVGKINVVN